jgi:hypothetical protein
MARISGKAGAATIGGTAVVLTGWTFESRSTNIEATAAGDVATERIHLRTDWTATIRARLSATPPYDVHTDLVGTEAAIVLKMLAGDTNGVVSDTGLVNRTQIVHNHDGATELEVEVVSSDGSAGPTYDESPAS